MNNNKKSQVRNILGFVSIYTFIFLCLAFVLDRIFDSEGKTFIWSIDGLFQHVIALKYIRQYIINLFTKGSFPMIDFNLGQGFDVIGTLNYYENVFERLVCGISFNNIGKNKNINNTSCLHFVPVL